MEGNKAQPRAFLIFGAPCSGKTSFSEKFAKRFNLAFFDISELQATHHLSRKLVLILIEQISKTGRTIIIEGGLRTEKERSEIRRILKIADYNVFTIWIQTDISTVRARLKVRYKTVTKAKETFDDIVPKLEAPSELENPIILSGKHTFETQLKHVLSHLAE